MKKNVIFRVIAVTGIMAALLLSSCSAEKSTSEDTVKKSQETKTTTTLAEKDGATDQSDHSEISENSGEEDKTEDSNKSKESDRSSESDKSSESDQTSDSEQPVKQDKTSDEDKSVQKEKSQEKMAGYVEQLRQYAESGAWKADCENRDGAVPEECNDLAYSIFDLDEDGIPEMLVYASAPQLGGPRLMTMSAFCVIENEAISIVLSGSTCGGTMGGTTISMVCRKDTQELQIVDNMYAGGFGGNANENHYYTYSKGSVSEVSYAKAVSYFNPDNGTDEYIVNGENVTSDDVKAHNEVYERIAPDNIGSYIETY